MVERIIIAGSGGQGIMLLGKILAQGAMEEGKAVTWIPSYGAEVRGGTAYCMVVISDEEISSPYISEADTLIIMNEPSLIRFKSRIKHNGLLLINHSLAKGDVLKKAHILRHPFTDIAVKLGNSKVANVVALGCYLANKRLVGIGTIERVIEDIAPADKKGLVGINKEALREGTGLK